MPQTKAVATSAEYNSKGTYLGTKAAPRQDKVAPLKVESEEDKRDKEELARANEWDRASIERRQAKQRADRAARAAAASPSPSPSASPAKKAVNPNKPNEPF